MAAQIVPSRQGRLLAAEQADESGQSRWPSARLEGGLVDAPDDVQELVAGTEHGVPHPTFAGILHPLTSTSSYFHRRGLKRLAKLAYAQAYAKGDAHES